jgi:hypothetical protein
VVSIVADKTLFPDISEEKIYVCLEECDKSGVRFDYIPHPRFLWSNDLELKGYKELPEKGIRKGTIYKTGDQERADTFLYVITPENLTLMKPVEITLRSVECILGSSGFVFVAIKEGMKETNDFKTLLIEQSEEYSGIHVKEFREIDEKEILEWVLGDS